CVFFFQAEDGIRDFHVTGVQTCALPIFFRKKKLGYFSRTVFLANILAVLALLLSYSAAYIDPVSFWPIAFFGLGYLPVLLINIRSEERRVGKECRCRCWADS